MLTAAIGLPYVVSVIITVLAALYVLGPGLGLDNQPPEGSDGLNDEELVQLGLQSGLDEAFGPCVRAGKYLAWAEYVTAMAVARGVNGTPSVYVDGMGVPASADAIMAAALAG